ncbi:MAG TPA: HAMP domain-containing sensor histidine kinase [Chitinophagaceae bacterium]|nr:HAMP domain-containing sensor histidine kinase [Chitinophagaceae bacterium]
MKGNNSRFLLILMTLAILVVTGFQLFWLKKSYDEEKNLLQAKAGLNFRQTIYNLQAQQFRKRFRMADSNVEMKMVKSSGKAQVMYFDNSEQVVGMVNQVRDQVRDSSRTFKPQRVQGHVETIMIRSDSFPKDPVIDSMQINSITVTNDRIKGDKFVQLISGIDSVKDSLKVRDITRATEKSFFKEGLSIPFEVVKIDSAVEDGFPPPMDKVTVGFSKPVTYRLDIGNTAGYMFRKLSTPLLFSVFLLTITILSFVLMYRSLRQQQRLAELKNDFISNVTHELKTPIATVNVALEALKNFNAINDPRRTMEYLDISQQELQRLSLLVDKVLRVSMFENKTVELKPEPFSIVSLVNEVRSSMRLQFEKMKAEVRVDTEGEDMHVNADKLHIMSVIYNLFDNALKYSREDPRIKVGIIDKGDRVELRFSDNGIGIPDEYRSRVFDKFFRVPHGDVHNVKGYGLGLSYVAHIIHEHNGTIAVESGNGSGTTFIINLPKNYA